MVFRGVLTLSKNIINKKFDIYNEENDIVATVSEKAIYKKKLKNQLSKEYTILIGKKEYEAKYTFALKKFVIEDKSSNICVEGELVSLIFMNVLERRKYKVDVLNDEYTLNLWLAIITGIKELH
ncbi:hypothetical protein WAK64_06725 [Bacillus spongiae]|uniref:Uncharacterized protein n=1 Tax=Bacillus spongiae TaxID=2683610 RepID=A0ABU8HBQ9_9BACI